MDKLKQYKRQFLQDLGTMEMEREKLLNRVDELNQLISGTKGAIEFTDHLIQEQKKADAPTITPDDLARMAAQAQQGEPEPETE